MATEFTPLASLLGGALIGLAAVMLMATHGKIAGMTAILSGVLPPLASDWAWRAAFLVGAIGVPALMVALGAIAIPFDVPVSTAALVAGGLIVGAGVTYGSGCTSGHGVCGIARLSPRSLVATAIFMAATFATVFVVRHRSLNMRRSVSALVTGAVFGSGIAISGMGNPAKVLNFFDLAGTFDASLLLVMASALAVTAIGYRVVFATRPTPLCAAKFDLPTNRRIDLPLVAGSAVFGIGWGITGFCPGGAVPMLGLGNVETPIFILSMLAGIVVARSLRQRAARLAAA